MHITFRQLRLFEALANTGSVSAAARAMHVTQPTASMQLKEVTEAVGLPLYEVIGKKVHLTDVGQELAATARAMALTLHYHPLSSYCQKLLIALYELGKDFRNESVSYKHQPEFTMLEWYRVGEGYEVLMADVMAFLVSGGVTRVTATPAARINDLPVMLGVGSVSVFPAAARSSTSRRRRPRSGPAWAARGRPGIVSSRLSPRLARGERHRLPARA